MSLSRRIVQGAEYRSGLSGLANPAGWLIDALSGGARSYSGKKVTPRNSLGISHMWGAVNLICGQMSLLPLKVYRELGDDSREEARDHRAWRMLHDKPNPLTTADRFWASLTAQLLLWGNAFVEKLRGPDGLVEELWLWDPAGITVEWDGNLRQKTFVWDGPPRRRWTDEQMLHIFGFSIDGIYGLSPIQECRQALGTAQARDEFEGGFYARGGMMRGFVQHPEIIGEEAIKNLRMSVNGLYGGTAAAGSHGIGVLEEGATFTPITMPLEDMQFVQSKQLTATEVANIFNIPPSFLGGSSGDSLTYATVEGNKIQLAQTAIAPRAHMIATAFSMDPGVFPQNRSYTCEFLLEGMLRGDEHSRAEFYKSGIEAGWLLKSEARKKENLTPVPGIDKPPEPPPMLNPPPDADEDEDRPGERAPAPVAG